MRWFVVFAAAVSCGMLSTQIRAQTTPLAPGGGADLEQQVSAIDKELKEAEQKKEERVKFLQQQVPLADLRKVLAETEGAFQAFMKSSNVAALAAVRDAARTASAAALEEAKKTDTAYTDLRKKATDARARRSAAGIADAAASEIDKEIAGYEKQKVERRKAIEALPAVAEAAKKMSDAESTYQACLKDSPDYDKLRKARDDASAAYNKALESAKTGDAEYGALRSKVSDLRARRNAMAEKISAAKAALSKPLPPAK